MHVRLLLTVSTVLIAGLATAGDLFKPPRVGATAPAFGLQVLNPESLPPERAGAPVILDAYCGLRDKGFKSVLVSFVSDAQQGDLATLAAWQRTYGPKGFQALAVSTALDPTALAAAAARAGVPLLDDRLGIVGTRYGHVAAPFTLVLDGECRVVGLYAVSATEGGDEVSGVIAALVDGSIPSRRLLR